MKNVRKNSLLTPLFVFVMLIGFMGCKKGDKKEDPPNEPDTEVKAPKQIVTVARAKAMFENYTTRRAPLIEKYEDSVDRYVKKRKDTFDVARYIYYDYDTIKQYLKYIEQEAKLANVEISTLRFYFSNYPDKARFPDRDSIIHPRQNSIFIMPTLKKGNKDFGFFTRDGEQGERVPVLLTYDLKEYSPEGMGGTLGKDTKSYATFVPDMAMSGTKAPSVNFFIGKSLILNEGGGAPPPH